MLTRQPAGRALLDEPRETEPPEGRVRRGYVDALWAHSTAFRRELHADGPEAQDLVDVANIGLALSNPRRNPPAQEIGITLDIGGKIKHLLATKGSTRPTFSITWSAGTVAGHLRSARTRLRRK